VWRLRALHPGGGMSALAKAGARAAARLRDPRDTAAATAVAAALLCGEAALCALIIWRVPYTEIDWQARQRAAWQRAAHTAMPPCAC
jgi:hypothetical protein